jgi:hypothetical protein
MQTLANKGQPGMNEKGVEKTPLLNQTKVGKSLSD